MTRHASHFHRVGDGKEQEYLAGWQRARAELDNFRKRLASEGQEQRQAARHTLIHALLPLADNLQAMISHLPPQLAADPWAAGVVHIARQYDQLLAELGVKVFGAAGELFDPAKHEAVEKVAGEDKEKVAEVLQRGYKIGGKVIRPAKVKVSA